MEWLAHQLQVAGQRVFCMRPEDLFPLGGALFFDVEGNPEKIDIIYRFFELFDLASIKTAPFIFEAWAAGDVAIAPPMRPFQEEKLAFALFHHHLLQDYWEEALGGRSLKLLRSLIPPSWVMDPAPLPPGRGPRRRPGPAAARSATGATSSSATQKERDLIIKISGFHETAWGARSVVLGSDCSREEWQAGRRAGPGARARPTSTSSRPTGSRREISHPLYGAGAPARGGARPTAACGSARIISWSGARPRLSGGLATFCPPDKKIIHGMQDAALLPIRILPA